MSDYNDPKLSSLYTDFPGQVKDPRNTIAQMFENEIATPTDTNIPVDAKGFSISEKAFKRYNGATWGDLIINKMVTDSELEITGGNFKVASNFYAVGTSRFDGNVAFGGLSANVNSAITVNGDIAFADATYADKGKISLVDEGSGNGTLAFSTRLGGATATKMSLTSEGKLGIGTTAPKSKVHIVGGAVEVNGTYAFIAYGVGETGNTNFERIRMDHSAGTGGRIIIDSAGTGINRSFHINTGGADRVTVDNVGNVGIGTASSQTTLHIGNSTANPTIFTTQAIAGAQNTTNYVAGVTTKWVVGVHSSGSLNNDWNVGTAHNTSNFIVKSNGTVIVNSASAITQGSSDNRFQVSGDINLTGDIYKSGVLLNATTPWVTSGSDIYYSTGRISVGTATPLNSNSGITVNTSGFIDYGVSFTNGVNTTGVTVGVGGGGYAQLLNKANSDLLLGTNNTERVRVLANGKVGVNEDTPLAQFQVDGEIHSVTAGFYAGSTEVLNISSGSGGRFKVMGDAEVRVFGHIMPQTDSTFDIGDGSHRLRTIFTDTITLKEITTPTSEANHGKVYTKSDNKLYFQDGAGTEHEIAFV